MDDSDTDSGSGSGSSSEEESSSDSDENDLEADLEVNFDRFADENDYSNDGGDSDVNDTEGPGRSE